MRWFKRRMRVGDTSVEEFKTVLYAFLELVKYGKDKVDITAKQCFLEVLVERGLPPAAAYCYENQDEAIDEDVAASSDGGSIVIHGWRDGSKRSIPRKELRGLGL